MCKRVKRKKIHLAWLKGEADIGFVGNEREEREAERLLVAAAVQPIQNPNVPGVGGQRDVINTYTSPPSSQCLNFYLRPEQTLLCGKFSKFENLQRVGNS